ncbi:uncharacterized protein CLAFUR5_10729 [Fulvia fulva]|uniref:Uncharacterized protein n=1 Tax=Passalora fulva TaxID=5499 RepID=A0A9Q8PD27_PASFU|nr:uncharacterized protein CLAFUR5_10729 [Fulvia fulva]KAK4620361.1 hypothetical protein CLAFUR0_11699 [Fulvia fulva]UJO20182.1 hypothetical protein CLAFUR5_10729 [Fulvia fulva]WPV31993.1 hypothetical protein CLAFUW7_11689 [Fulvia fulva]
MSQPDNTDTEPGLKAPETRSRTAQRVWLKVATATIVVAVISLLSICTIAPPLSYNTRSTTELVVQNASSVWQPIPAHEPFAFQKRDDWWDKKVKKGHWLPQAQWTDFAALEQNGWETEQWTLDKPGDNPFLKAIRALKIRTVLQIFGLSQRSTTPSAWTEMDHDHPASEASYQNLFSLADGVLVADFNYSPDYQIKLNELDVTAPALTQWSDIVFLDWQELHHQAGSSEEQKRKIQHFLRIKIRNEETVSTARAARNGGVRTGGQERPPGYPGWEWKIHEEAAEAIMGTANGAGTAYFLVQHKAYFGLKGLDSIRAFDCTEDEEDDFEMCLDFHVVDGPVVMRED